MKNMNSTCDMIFFHYDSGKFDNWMKQLTYTEIINSVSLTKTKYVDHDFHPFLRIPQDDDLFVDVTWVRIEELYSAPIFKENINSNSIKQGKLEDCHIISALIAISNSPSMIENLFEKPICVDSGAIGVKFNYFGEIITVLVDTLIPTKNGKPIFSHPNNPNEDPWWFMIVEKSFAKLYGSYHALCGGKSHSIFFRLIGGWPFAFFFNEDETQAIIENDKLWKRLYRWNKKGYPMCCGSLQSPNKESTSQKKNQYNIYYDHSYAILRVEHKHKHNLLFLRNTWGKSEWSGHWGINSRLWYKKSKTYQLSMNQESSKFDKSSDMCKVLNYDFQNDGNFWMSYHDFKKHFSCAYVDVVLDPCWHKFGVGGTIESVNENDNPNENAKSIDINSMKQWLVTLNQPSILKCIFEKRGPPTESYACLAKNNGKKLETLNQEICENEDSFLWQNFPETSDVFSFRWEINDCSQPWTLLICKEVKKNPVPFYLTVYSLDEIQFEKI